MNLLSIPATIDVSTNFVICHNFISCLVMKVPHILVLCYLISLPSSGINHKKVYFNQFCDLFTTTSVNNLINELAIFILSKKKSFFQCCSTFWLLIWFFKLKKFRLLVKTFLNLKKLIISCFQLTLFLFLY